MVRWRFIFFLAMLVVAQAATNSKDEDDDDNIETTTTSEEDNDDDDDEVSTARKPEPSTTAPRLTRTTSGNPLQCYVCSYKRDSSEQRCLDPLRHNVSSTFCRTPGDKCFTAVESKDAGVSIVVRGCKSACLSTPDIFCCETDLCNSQLVGRQPHYRRVSLSGARYPLPHSVLYFVTVLLLLHAVVKVSIV